jgi:hypothetical protein
MAMGLDSRFYDLSRAVYACLDAQKKT